jgi:hypothetical protein
MPKHKNCNILKLKNIYGMEVINIIPFLSNFVSMVTILYYSIPTKGLWRNKFGNLWISEHPQRKLDCRIIGLGIGSFLKDNFERP